MAALANLRSPTDIASRRKWLGATIKPPITGNKLPLGNNTPQPVDAGTAKDLIWWSTITTQ